MVGALDVFNWLHWVWGSGGRWLAAASLTELWSGNARVCRRRLVAGGLGKCGCKEFYYGERIVISEYGKGEEFLEHRDLVRFCSSWFGDVCDWMVLHGPLWFGLRLADG